MAAEAQVSGALVTVGVPTFNRPAGLRRTLQHMTAQTHRNLEIIVADNCSATGETEAVVRELQRHDQRIVYHRHPANIGIDANFRFLLAQARGEYFMWAADDDEHSLDFIEVCLAHIGRAGSAMTGMRSAVRPRGLLRWKPPSLLSAERRPFDNAVAFLSNPQPSLFYGLHRTETARVYLSETMYSYYDYFFIIRQILTHGFAVAPQICFDIGIDSEEPALKPARPRPNAVYEYWPFLRDSLAAVLRCGRLARNEKLRLGYVLAYVAVNEFAFFERAARPMVARLAGAVRAILSRGSPLMRVSLPPRPSDMALPADPEDLCTMFVPAAQLASAPDLRRLIEARGAELLEKQAVIANLVAESAACRRRPAGWIADLCWRLTRGGTAEADRQCAASAGRASPAEDPLRELRRRLGGLLREVETVERRLQLQLARLRRQQRWIGLLRFPPIRARSSRRVS